MKPTSVRPVLALVALCLTAAGGTAAAQAPTLKAPEVLLRGVPFTVTVQGLAPEFSGEVSLVAADGRELARVPAAGGEATFSRLELRPEAPLPWRIGGERITLELDRPVLPGWLTLLPPLLAIGMALLVREAVTSLFVGLWLGCLFLAGYHPIAALGMTVGRFARDALVNADHAAIVIFSMLLGGMVGILSRVGAMRSVVDRVAPAATTRRRGQLATWLAGLMIFFDDYSNTLLVGNTMRPLTDRLRISREKLAYIVDSTAAPVSVLAFVSTWVGFEISLIGDGLAVAEAQGAPAALVSPFAVFLASIPYLFYPLLALLLVFLVAVTRRDFGPMLTAERRAASGGGVARTEATLAACAELEEAPGEPEPWWTAVLAIVTVVGVVLTGLVLTGLAKLPAGQPRTLSAIFGGSDPFQPLLWGSLAGCLVAGGLTVVRRRLSLGATVEAWAAGMRSMLTAMAILVLAWSLGAVTESLGTAPYLSALLSDRMPITLLPLAVFLIGAAVSFATGTSWGTMAILLPVTIPLAMGMGAEADPSHGSQFHVLLGVTAGVMAGAIFGDHCSPISDTTVLSSMASGCDHVDHVRTQLPYALLVAVIAALAGALPSGYGVSPWLSLAVGTVLVALSLRLLGRRVNEAEAT